MFVHMNTIYKCDLTCFLNDKFLKHNFVCAVSDIPCKILRVPCKVTDQFHTADGPHITEYSLMYCKGIKENKYSCDLLRNFVSHHLETIFWRINFLVNCCRPRGLQICVFLSPGQTLHFRVAHSERMDEYARELKTRCLRVGRTETGELMREQPLHTRITRVWGGFWLGETKWAPVQFKKNGLNNCAELSPHTIYHGLWKRLLLYPNLYIHSAGVEETPQVNSSNDVFLRSNRRESSGVWCTHHMSSLDSRTSNLLWLWMAHVPSPRWECPGDASALPIVLF